tara:strand:- start:8630 stop:9703 length:1074 start_codon:yes stop_codon:yes gene_type:complete
MTNIQHISSCKELNLYLSNLKTTQYNFIGYIWHEYGWFPFYFNELFSEFFQKKQGPIIATCLPGHEFFYEDKVDELIVLDNFVNTTNAYVDSKETDLLKNNSSKIKDKGISFWLTVRNFDENEFDSILYKYQFKSIIYPIGRTKTWDHIMFPNPQTKYQYASGEVGNLILPDTCEYGKYHGNNKWTYRWDESKHYHRYIDRVIDGDYDVIFVKNSWKTRTSDNKPGFGHLDQNLFESICNHYIKKKRRLLVIDDLVEYDIKDNKYVSKITMKGFLDVKKLLQIIYHANTFITAATGFADLSLYYCPNTNLILLDDMQKKLEWATYVLNKSNKTVISINSSPFNKNEFLKLTTHLNLR